MTTFNNLPLVSQQAAKELFTFGNSKCADFSVRTALIRGKRFGLMGENKGCYIPDPIQVTDNPDAWKLFQGGIPKPEMHAWRLQQAIHNQPYFGWNLKRNQYKDRPAYIVGNGPSAKLAQEMIPSKPREGIVIATNGAGHLFPGDMDIWVCCDALWPDGDDKWLQSTLKDWRDINKDGAELVFSVYANHTIICQEDDGNFYIGAHRNPFRALLTCELPSFIEGLQGIVTMIHLAYYLGCNPIVLFGVDQGRIPGKPFHAAGNAEWREMPAKDQWFEIEGVNDTTVQTNKHMLCNAFHIMAAGMWLADAGIQLFNASMGMKLHFVPWIDAGKVIDLCEEVACV